jgi:hypothetical protein
LEWNNSNNSYQLHFAIAAVVIRNNNNNNSSNLNRFARLVQQASKEITGEFKRNFKTDHNNNNSLQSRIFNLQGISVIA